MYRIEIDRSMCSGFGSCAAFAPRSIRRGADGIADPLEPESSDPVVFEAAASCPMGAIVVRDDTGRPGGGMGERVLIVGAGLAGRRCAQPLRTEGLEDEITLVGEERHRPDERPVLPRSFLPAPAASSTPSPRPTGRTMTARSSGT